MTYGAVPMLRWRLRAGEFCAVKSRCGGDPPASGGVTYTLIHPNDLSVQQFRLLQRKRTGPIT